MAKESLTVWLKAIMYGGAKIGEETRFEISINGGPPTKIQVPMKPGTTRFFNKVVLMNADEKPQEKITISATAIEEDLIDDRGTNTVEFDVRSQTGPQVLTVVPTPVPENLGIFGTRGIATFEFSFELERWSGGGPGIRYVVSDDNGWLTIRAEDKKGDFSLPHLAKVQVTRVGEDREYLTVLEGAFKGRKGSVSFRNGVSSLSPAPPIREPAIQLVYHRKSRQLDVPGLGTFDVAWPPTNPFPAGATFNVEIPDYPHEPGLRYQEWSTFATSWFRIADPKVPDRYLHVGKRSAGCATVKDDKRWDEIYQFLIRRLDDKNVATLTVVAD